MQQLRIEDLLRYAFSGALLFITLILTHPASIESIARNPGIGQATLAVGLVLLTGSLIYAFNRAVIFPLILFPLALMILVVFRTLKFDRDILIPVRQSQFELDLDQWRLKLRAVKDPMDATLAEWGAQVHFLYCSGLAILFAIYLSSVLPFGVNYDAIRAFFVASIVLLCGGLYQHLRLVWRINREMQHHVPKTPPNWPLVPY